MLCLMAIRLVKSKSLILHLKMSLLKTEINQSVFENIKLKHCFFDHVTFKNTKLPQNIAEELQKQNVILKMYNTSNSTCTLRPYNAVLVYIFILKERHVAISICL